MPKFQPQDPDWRARVEASFRRQRLMDMIGARIVRLEPGECVLALEYRPDLTQQHGYLHAGISTTLADSAAGYAAYSLMPAGSSVVSVEFKTNLLAPAVGERFEARAKVRRAGRNLSVVESEVVAFHQDREKPVALMLATMMCLADTPDDGGRAG